MKRAWIWLLLTCLLLLAQAPVTIADISGDGAAHAVAASGTAITITFRAADSNSTATCGTGAISGCVRIGDANISTSRGQYLKPGESAYLGTSSVPGVTEYQLSQWYYLVQAGDKLVVSYVKK